MIGYLFYNHQDIERNKHFIDWLIQAGQSQGLVLELHTQNDYKNLKKPDFIINRSRMYEISEFFNVTSFNSADVTRIANDKYLTYLTFKDKVKMLFTSKEPFYPSIVKAIDGHGGHEVYKLSQAKDLPKANYLYQKINSVLGKDLRVYILDNKILSAVLRTNKNSFKSNYSLGGSADLYHLNQEEIEIVHNILAILPIHYGGIDFLFDENNKLILNEIEDPVGARMLYNLTDLDIVNLFISSIKIRLKLD